MGRYLVIGDSHIPRRAREIPDLIKNKIIALTKSELFDYTFFTGDLIKAPEFMNFLNLKTKKNVFAVIGNMDYFDGNRDLPLYQELSIELFDGDQLRIGLTHGAQIEPRGDHDQLTLLAEERGYNILISGHTHKEEVFFNKGILLLNPGSVTGAWSFVASGIPTFMVMKLNENTKEIEVLLFHLNVKMNKIDEVKYSFIFQRNRIDNKFLKKC